MHGRARLIDLGRPINTSSSVKAASYQMASFKLGIDAGDHLIVEINGRPDDSDDWLAATISLRGGAFSATINANLVTCDFPRFRSQLETLYQTLSGTALFDTMERQLQITCAGNDRGGILVDVVTRDQVADGNELCFGFDIDQTFLPGVIAELREIEAQFPNKIHPEFP